MENFLVFRLYGPLVSWGEIAVGEVRRSAMYPSRSALLGIVSAALGIRRDKTEDLIALFQGYDVAVKVQSVGTLLKDYHTVQVPDNTGRLRYATRRDELVVDKDRLGTILTSREYRCDALAVAALRSRREAPYSLEKIKSKLLKPDFVLYLGRKSCPLSIPLKPQIVAAIGFRGALDGAQFPSLVVSNENIDISERFLPLMPARYYWENDAGDMTPHMTHERYDEPLNRTRWQFAPRKEHSMSTGGVQ